MESPSRNVNPWIKVADFVESTYWLSVSNLTTQTPVPETAGGVELVEVAERGLSMKAPHVLCSIGHHLIIRIVRKNRQEMDTPPSLKDNGEVSVTAKVSALEKIDTKFNLVSVNFYQFNEAEWKRFLLDFTKRQDKANSVVKDISE